MAKKGEKNEIRHIAGAFETQQEKCCIITEEEQEAGIYLVYVEMDKLTSKGKFSVLIMAHQIELIKEVKSKKYPNFIMK